MLAKFVEWLNPKFDFAPERADEWNEHLRTSVLPVDDVTKLLSSGRQENLFQKFVPVLIKQSEKGRNRI